MKLAVVSIHGMGKQEENFADAMHLELQGRFGGQPGDLVFDKIFWADVLSGAEDKLFERVTKTQDLDFVKLRRFIVNALGDAIAYQPLKEGADPKVKDVYVQVHEKVAACLQRVTEKAGEKAPLVILAHSLGSVIISNYLWDLWKPSSTENPPVAPGSPLERGETLAGLVTFGCPIALWSLRYPDFGEPIPFPHSKLATHYPKAKAQWLNLFDQDDVLAYPLRDVNASYKKVVTEDAQVSVGGLFTGWSPLSHNGYWTDDDFTKRVAALLTKLAKDTQ